MQPDNPSPGNPYYPPGPAGGVPQQYPPQQPPISPETQRLLKPRKPVGLLISVVLLSLLLATAASFAFWAYGERDRYKNKTSLIVASAVKEAEKKTTERNNVRFAEELKSPLKTYTSPASFGTVKVLYPKTWSAFVNAPTSGTGTDFKSYFHPEFVPAAAVNDTALQAALALQVSVLNQQYDTVLNVRKGYVTAGTLKAEPYALPKMPNQIGTRFTGKLANQLNGIEIIFPLRDKTLVITTETDSYRADFEKYVIPNLSFVP